MPRKLDYWLPPIIWMGAIYYFSSFPKVAITENELYAFILFKSLHLVEYGVLFILLFRAFYTLRNKKIPLIYIFLLALLVGVIYALFDEIHQTFIPTREGKLSDVIIDTTGMILVYIYIRSRLDKLSKFLI